MKLCAVARYLVPATVVALAACNQTAAPRPAPSSGPAPSLSRSDGRLPEGAGCAGEIARTRAVLANDRTTGNVNESVYRRITSEIEPAASACAAGRDAEATRMLTAVKARHGYR